MGLAGTIARLAGNRQYTVTRSEPSVYEAGRLQGVGRSTFKIVASIQPATSQDLLRLPEGERTSVRIVVYTAAELRTAVAPGGPPADRISYQGDEYEVEKSDRWEEPGGFYALIARKVPQGT